jgi:hypothetical protein
LVVRAVVLSIVAERTRLVDDRESTVKVPMAESGEERVCDPLFELLVAPAARFQSTVKEVPTSADVRVSEKFARASGTKKIPEEATNTATSKRERERSCPFRAGRFMGPPGSAWCLWFPFLRIG